MSVIVSALLTGAGLFEVLAVLSTSEQIGVRKRDEAALRDFLATAELITKPISLCLHHFPF